MATEISLNSKLKRNALLHQVRRIGTARRLELSRQLGISNSRICELVQQMLDEGQLKEDHQGRDRRGRRGVPVRLNPQFGHLAGFDFEAKRMRLAVVDFEGRLVWQRQRKLSPPVSRRTLLEKLLGFIDRSLGEVPSKFSKLLGIGLAAPGVVDIRGGTIIYYDHLKHARDLPLRDLVEARTGIPCVMERNVRALTLAEWMEGAAQHLDSFICLSIRSGIGAGIVLNGQLLRGSHGFAGRAGLIPLIQPEESPARWKRFHEVASEKYLGLDFEAAEYGLNKSRGRKVGHIIAGQLLSLALLLDPQAIVLAGGIFRIDGNVWEVAERVFRELAPPELAERVQFLPARLGPFAAAIGATHCCFQSLFPSNVPAQTT